MESYALSKDSKRSLIWPTKYWNSYNRNYNSAVP